MSRECVVRCVCVVRLAVPAHSLMRVLHVADHLHQSLCKQRRGSGSERAHVDADSADIHSTLVWIGSVFLLVLAVLFYVGVAVLRHSSPVVSDLQFRPSRRRRRWCRCCDRSDDYKSQ